MRREEFGVVQESEKTQLYSRALANNECLSAVSEAGIKVGADGVCTCKHLHRYGCNYLDNQRVLSLSVGLRGNGEKTPFFLLFRGSRPR